MTPIVCIVGRSDSGKTTLIERLIPVFLARGFRVGTIKHDVHGFEIDHEGKDTWRHRQAGAEVVCISSPEKLAMVRRVEEEYGLERLAAEVVGGGVDVIIAEGYKGAKKPKVEVVAPGDAAGPLCAGDPDLVAVVSDSPLEVGVERFGTEEAEALASFLEERLFLRRPKGAVRLVVDGRPVELKPFVEKALVRTLRGFLSSLRGCEDAGEIELRVFSDEES